MDDEEPTEVASAPTDPSGPKAPPADIAGYLKAHPGSRAVDVAKAMGLNPGYVRRRVRELGLTLSRRNRKRLGGTPPARSSGSEEIPGPEMTARRGSAVPAGDRKRGPGLPGESEARRLVDKSHAAEVSRYAAETYDWVVAAGRAIWDLWDGLGYRASFQDAEEFADYLVAFFRENFEQVARLREENRELQARNEELSALASPVIQQRVAQERLVLTVLTAHASGTPLTFDEIRGLYSALIGAASPMEVLANG